MPLLYDVQCYNAQSECYIIKRVGTEACNDIFTSCRLLGKRELNRLRKVNFKYNSGRGFILMSIMMWKAAFLGGSSASIV